MSKYKNNKIVKDYKYWELHKEVFDEHFWSLDADIRQRIADNPYCKEAKLFEKKLEGIVSEKMGLTPA